MIAAEQMAVPPVWRALVSEINGGRVLDGEPGIRDIDAPCEAFEPAGKPFQLAAGTGTCETDGHHMCVECVHITLETLRARRDLCVECGAKLVKSKALGLVCANQCAASVPRW